MEMAKVTSKGQITIPVSIRKRLQINEGDKLLFIDRPDGVMMVNPALLGNGEDIDSYDDVSSEAVTQKAAASTLKKTSRINVDRSSGESKDSFESYSNASKSSTATTRPPVTPVRKDVKVGDLNLDSLLDEIRSIGLKV